MLLLPKLLQPPPWTFGPHRLTARAVSWLFSCAAARLPRPDPRSDQGAPTSIMHVVSNVVPIKSRDARGANALHRSVLLRRRVFIIDRPKTSLLAAILVAIALVAVGALAGDLLNVPRGLMCDAPRIAAPE
jgi:hypothetical protein